jgi:hypothetical protein
MTIDVRQAVAQAFEHARTLYEKTPLQDLRLEEVEFWDDGNEWLVTLVH